MSARLDMSHADPNVHLLAGAYALDALAQDERADFERHLTSCDACEQEIVEFGEVTLALGSAAAQTPPSRLRGHVLDFADRTRQVGPEVVALTDARPRQRVSRSVLAAAAALVLVAVLGAGAVLGLGSSRQPDEGPLVTVLAAQDTQTASLTAPEGTNARFVYSNELDRGVLVAQGLPSLPDDQTYQMWVFQDGQPTSAGLFRPDPDGRTVADVIGLGEDQGLTVTVEPSGGASAPTGEVVLTTDAEASP